MALDRDIFGGRSPRGPQPDELTLKMAKHAGCPRKADDGTP